MKIRNFNHLDLPIQWREYWTKYPHGYTIFEALLDWVNSVNDIIDNINDLNNYMDDFINQWQGEMKEEVKETLTTWKNDGVFDDIITVVLEGELDIVRGDIEDINNEITRIKDMYINVKDFGAIGDGVTNDTVAIQGVLDSYDGVIYFPNGDYLVTETLIIKGGQTILGESILNSRIKYLGDNDLFRRTDESGRVEFITIKDINLTGAGKHLNNSAINLTGIDHGYINRCYISEFNIGVLISDRDEVIGTGSRSYYNIIDEVRITSINTGVVIRGNKPNANKVLNSRISSCINGIVVDIARHRDEGPVNSLVFHGNYFYNLENSIQVGHSIGINITDNRHETVEYGVNFETYSGNGNDSYHDRYYLAGNYYSTDLTDPYKHFPMAATSVVLEPGDRTGTIANSVPGV